MKANKEKIVIAKMIEKDGKTEFKKTTGLAVIVASCIAVGTFMGKVMKDIGNNVKKHYDDIKAKKKEEADIKAKAAAFDKLSEMFDISDYNLKAKANKKESK